MECQGHDDERESFLARMDEVAPEFRRIRQEEKMKILMARADETSAKVEGPLYRYLQSVSASRESKRALVGNPDRAGGRAVA